MTRWLRDDDNIDEENTSTTMMLMSIMAFSTRAHLDRMKAKAGAKVAEECPALVPSISTTLVQVSLLGQLCRWSLKMRPGPGT